MLVYNYGRIEWTELAKLKPIYLACENPTIDGWRGEPDSLIEVERRISQSACVMVDSTVTPRELHFAHAWGVPIKYAESPDSPPTEANHIVYHPSSDDPFQPYLYWLYRRIAAHLMTAIYAEIPQTDTITWDDLWGRVILTGAAGSGKTITMLRFVRDVIVTRLQDSSHPLPIIAPAATWDSDRYKTLAHWLAHISPYLDQDEIQRVIQKGDALLLFDALEKLGTTQQDRRRRTTYDPRQRFIETLQQQAKRCRALISCRESDYNTLEKSITVEGVVKILPLDETQIDPALPTWVRESRLPQTIDLYHAVAAHHPPDETTALQYYIQDRLPDDLRRILGYVAMQNISSHLQHDNIITYNTFTAVISGDDRIHQTMEQAVQCGILVEGLQQQTFRFVTRAVRDFLATEAALSAINDDDPAIRRIAASVLGQLKHEPGVPALIQHLEDDNFLVRRTAAEALGIIQAKVAIDPLIRLLHVDEWLVRRYAAWALGQIGDTRAVPSLIHALQDPSAEVRFRAAEALGTIRSDQATRALTKALSDQNEIVRRFATWALKQIGTPEAMIALSRWNS